MKDYKLNPSTRPTVKLVGLPFYKQAVRKLPTGHVYLELVPEPDNPHGTHSSSVRHKDDVIGYIPEGRNTTYWNTITLVTASGFTAMALAKVYHGHDDYHEVTLYLLSSGKAFVDESVLLPKQASYDVPNAFKGSSGVPTREQVIADIERRKREGMTFTDEEVEAEIARRRRDNAGSASSDYSGCGCGVAFFIAMLFVVFILLSHCS